MASERGGAEIPYSACPTPSQVGTQPTGWGKNEVMKVLMTRSAGSGAWLFHLGR